MLLRVRAGLFLISYFSHPGELLLNWLLARTATRVKRSGCCRFLIICTFLMGVMRYRLSV